MTTAAQTAIAEPEPPLTVIRPSGRVSLNLGELWERRELVYFLTWRDIKVRYKQTVLGASWAILQPVLVMVVFSVVFGRLAEIPSDGIPYPIFAFAALVPWTLFSNGLSHASNSLVDNKSLLTKIYFPRLALPIASAGASVVDFVLAFGVLLLMMVYYGRWPTVAVLWLPCLLALALTTLLGASFWLAAVNVQYRDVRHALPFITQVWLFATPIAYPSSLLSEPWRTLFGVNPMAGVVEGFRWALLGTATKPGPMIAVSAAVSVALLVSGAFYFRRMERIFADVA